MIEAFLNNKIHKLIILSWWHINRGSYTGLTKIGGTLQDETVEKQKEKKKLFLQFTWCTCSFLL